jgi:hypothetical protein
MLLCINTNRFLQTRTEKCKASRDPEYAAYAQRINEHGLFRGVGRPFPFLRNVPPPADWTPADKPMREVV